MSALPFTRDCPLYAEMAVAADIARAAAPIVLRHFGRVETVVYKEGHEPVTLADRECHDFVLARLRAAFPDDAVLSEEGSDSQARLAHERVWIVDPLDGTREFIEGVQQFVIMIGLCIRHEPRLGVILQPGTGLLYMGIPGWNAFMESRGQHHALQVSTRAELGRMHAAVSRSHLTPLMEEIAESLGLAGCIRRGSAGLKAAMVATGEADCYFHSSLGMKEWDLCAPAALLLAAGARLTDCWGNPIVFNQPDIRLRWGLLASNGLQHEKCLDTVQSLCEAHGYSQQHGFDSH